MMIMRMQKEEKIVVVLLFMALGSLAAAFWAFSLDLKPGFDSNARFHSRQLWGKGAISSASEGYAGEDHRNHK